MADMNNTITRRVLAKNGEIVSYFSLYSTIDVTVFGDYTELFNFKIFTIPLTPMTVTGTIQGVTDTLTLPCSKQININSDVYLILELVNL